MPRRLLLLQLGSPPIHHIYKEQNRMADSLAKYGAKQADGSSCLLFVRELYHQDQVGTNQLRLVKSCSFGRSTTTTLAVPSQDTTTSSLNSFPFNVLACNAPYEDVQIVNTLMITVHPVPCNSINF
nr:uncharacterized protein LOC117275826 [Nicotiana tomentosiformis]